MSCRISILLSCGGEKSPKLDGQHNAGAAVTPALTALSNRMTHTPLSYTDPRHEGIESERKAFLLNVARGCAVEVSGDRGPEYRWTAGPKGAVIRHEGEGTRGPGQMSSES